MNGNCTACNIMIDINTHKKDRTVSKTCYNKNIRENNINTLPPNKINASYQQPNVENVNNKKKIKINNNKDNNNNVSTYGNHRHVIIGPSDVGKTYYMLKILEVIGNQRPTYILTR